MAYRFLEHATDAIVEVEAATLAGALEDAAEAVCAITLDPATVRQKEQRTVRASGKDSRYLLFNWLEEVSYLIVTEGFAPKRFEVEVKETTEVECVVTGEPLDLSKHGFRVEIKAPTFHEMEVSGDGPVYMKFLLDL